jgi:hypothetical protein
MKNKLVLEEVKRIFAIAYYIGVDDGEKGIPEDFTTYLPEHLEWYCNLQLKRSDEVFNRLEEYLYPYKYFNRDGTRFTGKTKNSSEVTEYQMEVLVRKRTTFPELEFNITMDDRLMVNGEVLNNKLFYNFRNKNLDDDFNNFVNEINIKYK